VKTPSAALAFGVMAGAALPCGGSHAAVSATQGRALAATCAACHDTDARDGTAIPPIAGMSETRMRDLMMAYRSGQRSSQIMHAVASALSADEIAAIAHYIAGQRAEMAQ